MQEIIIFIVFALAAAYVVRLVILNFRPKAGSGCAKGCGTCATVDFNKISKEIEARNASLN
ncbi:MAG: hypothetical protein AVDCRST_MAG95-2643 [uncultured Adhaeribacter sp.]|uniref:FeoB-associated Cys-rich membrane protein n=1 Tax=uncultured Adhaeribacter sp. TaxID=448109 RepID=A0A6J4J259_9BACT|nr:MAG: hypothetical protein AVDCRST_MAG95-2643 [uncultured Adhaeribacter sp.]